VPSKQLAREAMSIGQEEMPDCRGITYLGFKPHLKYDPKARVEAELPPRVECKEDSDIDSIKLVGSSADC
jgi:hypothetical protein